MNIENLIEFINNEFPKESENISSAIDLLIETLVSVKNSIISGFSLYSSLEYSDKFDLFRSKQIDIENLIKQLNSYIEELTPDFDMDESSDTNDEIAQLIETNENSPEQKKLIKKLNINYNDPKLSLDPTKPHTLYENFTYKKPCAIEINGQRIETSEWKEMILETCNYLNSINSDIFNSFVSDEDMNGYSRKYFSTEKKDIASPQKVKNSNIYVIGNISANQARNIVIRMLGKYDIPKRDFIIYLCKDLSSLHIQDGFSEQLEKEIIKKQDEAVDGELRIAQYVRKVLTEIFANPIPESELENMQNEDWCHENLGICYPLLKKYNPDIPIKGQLRYKNQKKDRSFYKDIITVNGKQFLLCQEWYEQYRDKFNNWLSHRNSNSVYVAKYIKIKNDSSSVLLEDSILISLLEIVRNNFSRSDVLIVKQLREQCERIIALNTKYKNSPQTVIYCLMGKLSSMRVIKLAPDCKKGRYVLNDSQLFDKITADRSLLDDR